MGNAASSLPYTIGKTPISPNVNDGWNLHDGQRKSDGTPVSVFIAKKPILQKTIIQSHNNMNTNRNNLTQYNCALHHYMYCKKLRHPNILTVTATLDTDNPNDTAQVSSNGPAGASSTSSAMGVGNTSSSSSSKDTGDLIVVTEPCIPFQVWMNQEPKPTIDQLVWGLQCIINALHFLHASANLCHGNISIDSFYVTPAGDVKLWNFSLVSSYTSTTPPSIPRHFIEYESILTPSIYRSPERVEQRWDVIASSGIHVLDSYALGIFISQIFQSPIYPLPTPLVKAVQRLQTTSIKMRPKLQPLLKCPIFDTIYPKLQLSIQEFNIMDIESKIQFWNTSLSIQQFNSNIIPKSVIIYKIIPIIHNEICTIYENENLRTQELYRKEVLVMLNPYFYILENVLDHATIGSNNIGKIIGILYKINDRAIRGTLLQKANYMADHFDKSILNDAVFEPMCGGFSDSSSALRELTLKATASLVPHLTHPNLEKLSRYLVRLQSDPESSIRTNTVIFFSKLAPYLTEVTRQKILLPAFVRAMKDPFTPCRLAALRSTVKAKTFFDPMGIASRVMPAITPQLLDPSAEVRREAFTAVDDLLFVLRQESERLSTLPEAVLTNPNIPVISNGTAAPSTTINPSVAPPPTNRPVSSTNSTTTAAAAAAPTSGGFSLGGISSWMSSSKPTTTAPAVTPSVQQPSQPVTYQQQPTYPIQQQQQAQPQVPPTYGVPTQSLNQMNLYSNNNADDNWDDVDVDDDNDDGGWGDDDDLDVSNPKSSMQQQPSQSNGTAVRSAPTTTGTTTSSSLFSAPVAKSNNDDDDFFGGFDNKPAKPIIRPMAGGTVGKLVVPTTKKSLGGGKLSTSATAKPIIKKLSSNDKDDIPDNWDDF